MKKNRNAFFAENNMMNYNPMLGGGYQASNMYYSGPMSNPEISDVNERISKIERSINRLDHRLSKLENTNNLNDDIESNNMYMI